MRDDLSGARGLVFGIVLSLIIWGVLALVAYLAGWLA